MPTKKPTPAKKAAPAAKPARRAVDWEAIERDFRATHLSAAEIAKRHGDIVSRQAINKRAREKGWQRDLTDAVAAATKAKVIQQEVKRRVDAEVSSEVSTQVSRRLTTTADVVEVAAELGAAVVMRHRDDIRATRDVAVDLLGELRAAGVHQDELERLFELTTTEMDDDQLAGARRRLETLLGLSGRVGNIQKLADTLTKLQTLERKAFGLDTGDEDGKKAAPPATKYELSDDELRAIAAAGRS